MPKQSEGDLQKALVKYIRLQYPKVVIRSNPLAELNIKGKSRFTGAKLKQEAARKGYTKGISDLFLFYKSALAIELKTPDKDPFRISKGGYWIETNESRDFDMPTEEGEHVLNQAYQLSRVCEAGGMGLFITNFDDGKRVIDAWMKDERMVFLEPYFFDYGMKADCMIYKFRD